MKNLLKLILITTVFTGGNMMAQAEELPTIDREKTAILITDPQKDFLHPSGKLYGLLKDNMDKLGTIKNIETLMKTAKKNDITLAVDPLVYTEADNHWENAGTLQQQLLDMGALKGSGADFYEPYKPYIEDKSTIRVAPHKMYGPESNDLVYQLRSRNIDTVILGGLVANLCVDSHMRSLMENGFKVYVVKDAVAAPGEDAYNAALVNYSMIANTVLSTKEAVKIMTK